MVRILMALFTIAPLCCAQNFPAFNWIQEVDGSGLDKFAGVGTDAVGNVYVVGSTVSPNFPVKSAVQSHLGAAGASNCFVTKLDPSGNVIYSTYFGGSGFDTAAAMVVDSAGNVYVTGSTGSTDFPTTKGTYSQTPIAPSQGPVVGGQGSGFLFKLNPDGSAAWSTYFAAGETPQAIAVDQNGSPYIAGTSYGGLPTTPGAYQTSYCCAPAPGSIPVFFIPSTEGFVTRFDAAASKLIYSTYLGGSDAAGTALAVASDGSAYVASSQTGVYRIDPTGSSLLASAPALAGTQTLTIAGDGSLYLAGSAGVQTSAGAFQPNPNPVPDLQGGRNFNSSIVRMDAQLEHTLAGTYFNGLNGDSIKSLALDAAGNVYIGGFTASGLPTRTPIQEGFGAGFLSELSGDLSTLLFSSYFGADYNFSVQGVAVGANGDILLAGPENVGNLSPAPSNIWVNSLTLPAPPALRIDSIVNAASLVDGTISAGETIVVRGAGFGPDAQLLIGGAVVPAISMDATEITATVPSNFPNGATEFVVQSGGAASNQVLVPVVPTSPGIFSVNGTGFGVGYILNQDGTLNGLTNPANPGDKITLYATGVGPISFVGAYAVTQYAPNVSIDGFYCDGFAAFVGPLPGFPGDVFQLTVYVPNPAALNAGNPNFANFTFPPVDQVILTMNGVASQYGIAIYVQ
jgi:uncharacterized protein (TIGR03437 family)